VAFAVVNESNRALFSEDEGGRGWSVGLRIKWILVGGGDNGWL
jgi:hypothetical protein